MSATQRHAAGEDPAKREQILNGAMEVFLANGFHSASMNDICRAAGVSKGTIYVYFSDKDDLFAAMIAQERDRVFGDLDEILGGDMALAEKLTLFCRRLAEVICSDRVIRAQRIVAANVDRLPDLGPRFYEAAASRAHATLLRLLRREADAGHLRLADPDLAAHQLIELATASLWRKRLFARMPHPPEPAQIAEVASSAVAVFLAAYGTAHFPAAAP